jgi:hypothetical protein
MLGFSVSLCLRSEMILRLASQWLRGLDSRGGCRHVSFGLEEPLLVTKVLFLHRPS